MTRPQPNLYFCFKDTSASKWSWLLENSKYKHVFLIMFDGINWIAIHPMGKSWRIEVLRVRGKNFIHRLEKALGLSGVIGLYRDQDCVEDEINPFFGVSMMCQEVVRRASGLKIPYARTPEHLARLLFKHDGHGYHIFYTYTRDYILEA